MRSGASAMNEHVCARDRLLTAISLLIGSAVWAVALLLLLRKGGAIALMGAASMLLLVAAVSFVGYLMARSAAIAHLKGNAIEVSEQQLPELHRQLVQSCEALGYRTRQRMYIQNGNGVLNAFATWFLGRQYVILLSNIVEAMSSSPNGVRFYIGHELGHVFRHDNPIIATLRWPALRLPLLGAAFSRARETSCDLHGLACSDSRESAARSLMALAAGERGWAQVSLEAYRSQLAEATGFWMSFHELIASYPWTVKRVIRVLDEKPQIPQRNPIAYLLALCVPYAGRMGTGFGMLLYVYLIGILAAIMIPAYQDYTVRAQLSVLAQETQGAREAIGGYYLEHRKVPASLDEANVPTQLPDGAQLSLDPQQMILSVRSKSGELQFTPTLDQGHILWRCTGGEHMRASRLPPECR